MNGKMYKLTGTGRFGKSPIPRGPRFEAPIPRRKGETIADHLPKTSSCPLPLPDKLRGK